MEETIISNLNSVGSSTSSSMPIKTRRVMLCVDNNSNRSTSAALALALKQINKQIDEMYAKIHINLFCSSFLGAPVAWAFERQGDPRSPSPSLLRRPISPIFLQPIEIISLLMILY